MQPERIQLSRRKGWRKPANTVVVARPTRWRNPFPVAVYGQAQAVDLHRRWLEGRLSADERAGLSRCDRWRDFGPRFITLRALRQWILGDLGRLRGSNLACWCGLDKPCHADRAAGAGEQEPAVMTDIAALGERQLLVLSGLSTRRWLTASDVVRSSGASLPADGAWARFPSPRPRTCCLRS
jgi:hypothetical protein